MLIKRPSDILSSEITSESQYLSRRKFMQAFAGAAAVAAGGSVLSSCADAQSPPLPRQAAALPGRSLDFVAAQPASSDNGFSTSEKLTPYEAVTSHNNFYEFGTDMCILNTANTRFVSLRSHVDWIDWLDRERGFSPRLRRC